MARRALTWGFGIAILAVACYAGSKILKQRESKVKSDVRRNQWANGTVPDLPEPYFPTGDPKDLKFEKIDLGIGKLVGSSERGDLLYQWSGDKPVETRFKDQDGHERIAISPAKPIFRVRYLDGRIETFPEAEEVRITASGRIFEIRTNENEYETQKSENGREIKRQIGERVFDVISNGKTIYHYSMKEAVAEYNRGVRQPNFTLEGMYQISAITDEGIFLNGPRGKYMAFIGEKAELTTLPDDQSPYQFQGSQKFGTLCIISGTGHNLWQLKEGKFTKIDLPDGTLPSGIFSSGNDIYISNRQDDQSIARYRDGKLERLPSIAHTFLNSIFDVGSSGHLMVSTLSTNKPLRDAGQQLPMNNEDFYISDEKAYSFQTIIANFGLDPKGLNRNKVSLDENGGIAFGAAVNDFSHVFLLRRLK